MSRSLVAPRTAEPNRVQAQTRAHAPATGCDKASVNASTKASVIRRRRRRRRSSPAADPFLPTRPPVDPLHACDLTALTAHGRIVAAAVAR